MNCLITNERNPDFGKMKKLNRVKRRIRCGKNAGNFIFLHCLCKMIHDYCTAFKPYGKIQGAAAGHPKPLWPEVMRVSSQTATPDTTSCTYAPRRVSEWHQTLRTFQKYLILLKIEQ